MEFVFFTNEFEEVLDLVKNIFNIDINNNTFILQDNQKILLLKVLTYLRHPMMTQRLC